MRTLFTHVCFHEFSLARRHISIRIFIYCPIHCVRRSPRIIASCRAHYIIGGSVKYKSSKGAKQKRIKVANVYIGYSAVPERILSLLRSLDS